MQKARLETLSWLFLPKPLRDNGKGQKIFSLAAACRRFREGHAKGRFRAANSNAFNRTGYSLMRILSPSKGLALTIFFKTIPILCG
jgi:hypothetical protein